MLCSTRRRTQSARCGVARDWARFALPLAVHAYAAIDRRMPEASALVAWLNENAASLTLAEADLPEPDGYGSRERRVLSVSDWRSVGEALAAASARRIGRARSTADLWGTAIARRLELDPIETAILALALQYSVNPLIETLFDRLSDARGGPTRLQRDPALIGLLLGEGQADIESRLSARAALPASGLLRVTQDGTLYVINRLLSLIRAGTPPARDFFDQLLGTTTGEPLPWEAFAHLGREAEIAARLLQAALTGRERGVHILLYGPPGTGKTAFGMALAAHLGVRLRPVAEADDDGSEPDRDERLAGLRLAGSLARPGDTLLLFDEAEDLFMLRGGMLEAPRPGSRVFLHRLLEDMPVPVIWTANDIGALGPAVVRRMTMCLEMKVPNVATRTWLWRRMGAAEGLVLAEPEAARLARLVPAAPAVAATALRGARLAGGGAETARLIVTGMARAVHGGALPAAEPEPAALYDPGLINADADLATLTAELSRPDASRAVSFLLSGPPGAGKSAWVRHLATLMGLPVLQKRASDLLNPYVGGTEQNIAGAFAEAREAQAFLVFDEADSLLLERGDAVRSWEISQVNEMLTWMEAHPLPFACTTNLAERLDRASLRRFLVKLRFGWLAEAQARTAFRRFFGLEAPAGLDGLRCLTPADFALVARRATLGGVARDPAALVRLLAAESAGRAGGHGPLGFAGSAAA